MEETMYDVDEGRRVCTETPAFGGSYDEPRNLALEKIQQKMYAVVVDRDAAGRAEKKLAKVLPNKWRDRTIVRKHYGIEDFTEYMSDTLESFNIPEGHYKEILFTYKHTKRGDTSILEVDFKDGELKTNYMFFALYKHPDGGGTDMVYLLYELTAEAQPTTHQVKIGERKSGWLWWKKVEPIYEQRTVPSGLETFQHDKDSKAFFRCKAMEGFADEGVLDREKLKVVNTENSQQTP